MVAVEIALRAPAWADAARNGGGRGGGPKTIRRDLDLFRALGFPLEETTGEFGRKTWVLKSPCDQPPLSFRYDEALALYLSRRFLEPLAGTLFARSARVFCRERYPF